MSNTAATKNNAQNAAFAVSKKLITFITAGDPDMKTTGEIIKTLAPYSDAIEIGLPFSDPVAEGEVIEAANMRALAAGATTDSMFDMLDSVGCISSKLIILTYLNPVFVYGYDAFFTRCKRANIWGIIVPDLPYEERQEVLERANKYGIKLITLISPTSAERISMLAKEAEGFIYLVSSLGVTGVRNSFSQNLKPIIARIKEATDVPVYIGFGVSTAEQVKEIRQISHGAIIGSAIVKSIEQHGAKAAPHLKEYLEQLQ